MANRVPYTYIQCPCSAYDDPPPNGTDRSRPSSANPDDALHHHDNDDRTFDPGAPRSNFSLFPLEHLLYCEECHQIRCPLCVVEEIAVHFCPNCLFEVPSSNVRTEGNRCTRSCFQCPICVGPLTVTSLDTPAPPSSSSSSSEPPSQSQAADADKPSHASPYILTCTYCHWASTEIGIKFDKPNGIYTQLSKLKNGGSPKLTTKDLRERRKGQSSESNNAGPPLDPTDLDAELQFAALKSFYQSQIADTAPSTHGGLSSMGAAGDMSFASPSSLSRIMSLYTGRGTAGAKSQTKVGIMREAETVDEGLKIASLDESASAERLSKSQWNSLTSRQQKREQQTEHPLRFQTDLRPIPYLLRTKRSKRCPECRHIMSKPDSKVSTSRFRIRLVASSYIPTITIKPLTPGDTTLHSAKPAQYIVTFKNPIYEAVKVTLATPAVTPGRFASRVTVLCPQFEIDANTDMWDDALRDEQRDKLRRESIMHQVEAGKIWDRGRNWVSIVLEVVPALLRNPLDDRPRGSDLSREDEDLLEIPMFVRLEWEADAHHDAHHGKDREKRELAYWSVLGLGQIKQE